MSLARAVFQLALQSLLARRMTWILGALLAGATGLLVLGQALVESVDRSMMMALTETLTGHLQVSSASSPERVDMTGEEPPSLQPIVDFERVRARLEADPAVRQVVPTSRMGVRAAIGSPLDLQFQALRHAFRPGHELPAEQRRALRDRAEYAVGLLAGATLAASPASEALSTQQRAALERVRTPAFWKQFDDDPLGSLELLENEVASLEPEFETWFDIVGTDLGAYLRAFSTLEIVDGTTVPDGARGILLSKYFYEQELKLKTARDLDLIQRGREEGRHLANDAELGWLLDEAKSRRGELLPQLQGPRGEAALGRVRLALHSTQPDPLTLLSELLTVTDDNFQERYGMFYALLVPVLRLYPFAVGDELTLQAQTRSGYVRAAKVRLWGTFQFKGLEHSFLVGNPIDLETFRTLYGLPTKEEQAEMLALESRTPTPDAASAEEYFFGAGAPRPSATPPVPIPGHAPSPPALTAPAGALVLNAAVFLRDPTALDATLDALTRVASHEKLGITVTTWRSAAGVLAQWILGIRMFLSAGVLVLFFVAMLIVSNVYMLATLRRVPEFGTLRALGAQPEVLFGVVLLETLMLGAVFGALGAGLGSVGVWALNAAKISPSDGPLHILFAGRLIVHLGLRHGVFALLSTGAVTALAAVAPAVRAVQIAPLRAMQARR